MRGRRYIGDKRTVWRYAIHGTATLEVPDLQLTLRGELRDVSVKGVGVQFAERDMHTLLGIVGILRFDSPDLPAPVTCYTGLARQIPNAEGTLVGFDMLSIDDKNFERISAYRALARARERRASAPASA